MSTISEELNLLISTKNAIKQSLLNKEVEVLDTDAFGTYPAKIDGMVLGIPVYESVEAMNADIKEVGEMAVVQNTEFDGIYESDGTKWVELFSSRRYDGTLTPEEYEEATATAESILGDASTGEGSGSTTVTGKIKLPEGTKFAASTNLEILDYLDASEVINMNSMFSNSYIKEIDLTGFDSSSAEDMEGLFESDSYLTKLNISGLKTDNVKTISSMFYRCSKLTEVDLSSFNTSNVTDMYYMFGQCSGLEKITLPETFDMSKVENTSYMFYGNTSLTDLDTSRLKGGEVNTTTYNMFAGCLLLPRIDLSNLDMSKVTTAKAMFDSCEAATDIIFPETLSTPALTNIHTMFSGCTALVNLDLSNFNLAKVTDQLYNAFSGCTSLSDDSLNSILKALSTGTNISTNRRYLTYVGLTEEQATRCTTLSNWAALEALGWTTVS